MLKRANKQTNAAPRIIDYTNLTKEQLKQEILSYPMGATNDDINVLKAKIRIIGSVLETESRGMFSGDKIANALGRKFDFKATELPDVMKAHAILGLHQKEALNEWAIACMHEMAPHTMGVDHRIVNMLGYDNCLTAPRKLEKAQQAAYSQVQ